MKFFLNLVDSPADQSQRQKVYTLTHVATFCL